MAAKKLGWLVLVTMFAVTAAPSCAGAADVSKIAEASWTEARTDNFVVLTNAGEGRARYLIENLEDFRRLVIEATNLDIESNPLPFHIVALVGASQLKALIGTDNVFGAFQQSYRGGLAAVNLTARAPDGTDSLQITYTAYGPIYRARQNTRTVGMDGVFHEYVHYLLEIDAKRRYPLWFHEGYAEFLSTFDVSGDGRYKVGAPPMHRVLTLEKTRRIPIGSLLNARGYETGHGNSDFNAESWLVVHYLMTDPDRRAKLYAFLDRLNTPMVDFVPAFEDVFGESIEDFSRHLRQYRRMARYGVERFERPAGPLPQPAIRVPPADEVREQLAYTLLHFSPVQSKGVELLQSAIATNPGNMRARALLAAVAITNDDIAKAETILAQAGPAADADPDVASLRGELDLRRAAELVSADKPGGEGFLAAATKSYRRALAIDPDHAQSLSGLARTWLIQPGRPPDEIIALVQRAQRLLPMNQEIELIAAHTHLKRGEIVDAVRSYEHVVAWGRDPVVVRQARERLEAIYAVAGDSLKQGLEATP
ncbi:tetratricopeptide repeat protein [Emcibacter sp. SYSU 3D8]|uniref:tetratricopeptide repeat protein n=1 Tax=Emcibacter sp. SYSU 3D8 TaxID=3133969 RepID=UPI0031FE7A60